jgi:hypothetical protein
VNVVYRFYDWINDNYNNAAGFFGVCALGSIPVGVLILLFMIFGERILIGMAVGSLVLIGLWLFGAGLMLIIEQIRED